MNYSPDFCEFFKLNRNDVEAILYSICNRYQSDKIDRNELYQDLFFALCRSDFLKRYDPECSKLSTYLYEFARGHAGHVVAGMFKRISKERKLGIPVYLDHFHTYGDEEIREEVVDVTAYSPEDYTETSDLREKIIEALGSDRLREIFDLMERGFGIPEIAKMYGNTRMGIHYHKTKIREVTRLFFPKKSVPKIRKGEKWSDGDIRNLKILYRSNTISQVAMKMGRTIGSIKCVLFKQHINKKGTVCLI